MSRAPLPDHLTMTDFARLQSVSRKTVLLWRRKGLLVMTETNLVDVLPSLARLEPRSQAAETVTASVGNTDGGNNLQERLVAARAVFAPSDAASEA